MSTTVSLSPEFERQKNVQAMVYTIVIATALLLIIYFIKFYEPIVPPAPAQEAIEINLGSSDVGAGKDQPQLPGEPAPEQQAAYAPSQPVDHTPQEIL